ncbi:MAG TPA: hypothetical protein VK929_14565 [Longimicrobiales bacterium]|nr:hypothetical protein [Longimicrobiales bacterium]
MDRFTLDGSSRRIRLGRGYAIAAPGLAGPGAVFPASASTPATRAAAPPTPELEAAFQATGLQEAATIALQVRATPRPPAAANVRTAAGEDALELEVPAPGPDREQVVLAIGEDGVITWHYPMPVAGGEEAAVTRAGPGSRRFRIPSAVAPPPEGPAAHRGFVGAAGRRLLKVMVYPVTDPILGAIGRHFAGRWEDRNRPYRLRAFTPDNYDRPDVAPLVTPEDWAPYGAGRSLLFVHGTFSTAHGCFGSLPRDFVAELHQRYNGRLLAFDTHTLSEDPAANARRFLELLPAGQRLECDVVCHSRGGLVTREIALAGADGGRVGVRRIVFVGVPNAGTALADPGHMTHMIDRFTSAVMLLPTGPVTETMEAIITAVKVIGHGVTGGLPGLASMQPSGRFLARLNRDGGPASALGATEFYAITADYAPGTGPLRSLIVQRAADALVDRVFSDVANDLVVPTSGVYDVAGPAGFPIPTHRVLRYAAEEGVLHTGYFSAPRTATVLSQWLENPADGRTGP